MSAVVFLFPLSCRLRCRTGIVALHVVDPCASCDRIEQNCGPQRRHRALDRVMVVVRNNVAAAHIIEANEPRLSQGGRISKKIYCELDALDNGAWTPIEKQYSPTAPSVDAHRHTHGRVQARQPDLHRRILYAALLVHHRVYRSSD